MRIIERTKQMPEGAKYRVKTMAGKYIYCEYEPKLTIFDIDEGLPTSDHTGWDYMSRTLHISDVSVILHDVPEIDKMYWKDSLVEICPEKLSDNISSESIGLIDKLAQYGVDISAGKNTSIIDGWKDKYVVLRAAYSELSELVRVLNGELTSCNERKESLEECYDGRLEEMYNCLQEEFYSIGMEYESLKEQSDRTEQHLRSAENALQYKEHIILFLKGEISDGWDRKDY